MASVFGDSPGSFRKLGLVIPIASHRSGGLRDLRVHGSPTLRRALSRMDSPSGWLLNKHLGSRKRHIHVHVYWKICFLETHSVGRHLGLESWLLHYPGSLHEAAFDPFEDTLGVGQFGQFVPDASLRDLFAFLYTSIPVRKVIHVLPRLKG